MNSERKTEIEFLTDLLIKKVWQGNESKRGLATQCASVAVAGIQDYAWELSAEWAERTGGREE